MADHLQRAQVEAIARDIQEQTPGDQLRMAALLLDRAKETGERDLLKLAQSIVSRLDGEIALVLATESSRKRAANV
jgi:F420-0:gamma-glutamyl ligase